MSEKPTLNIVLVEPRIPQNTGNVARTCACTACRLHLVGPMGFAIDDRKLKHAGLDYWHYLDISYYDGLVLPAKHEVGPVRVGDVGVALGRFGRKVVERPGVPVCTRCCASGIFRSCWTTAICEIMNGNEGYYEQNCDSDRPNTR